VLARIITPAMYWIGELWERGAITVADEHAATAIAHSARGSLHSGVGHPWIDRFMIQQPARRCQQPATSLQCPTRRIRSAFLVV
jgi:hypothetical protein